MLHVTMLQNWLNKIKEIKHSFDSIRFEHTYREFIKEDDALSKSALELREGIAMKQLFQIDR